MNVITNYSLIRRMNRIGMAAMLSGMAVLGLGMYFSFTRPEENFIITMVALLFGFILSQVGISYSNRYGKRPRPDELLTKELKGFDNKYTLYHYMTPTAHLLVGPTGVWILMPRSPKGRISYSNGRWKNSGGNIYLRIFGQESLGRPDLDLASEKEKILKVFNQNTEGVTPPDIRAALVLTHPRAIVNIAEDETPPAETVSLDKLKETIRKKGKSAPLGTVMISQITGLFPTESK